MTRWIVPFALLVLTACDSGGADESLAGADSGDAVVEGTISDAMIDTDRAAVPEPPPPPPGASTEPGDDAADDDATAADDTDAEPAPAETPEDGEAAPDE